MKRNTSDAVELELIEDFLGGGEAEDSAMSVVEGVLDEAQEVLELVKEAIETYGFKPTDLFSQPELADADDPTEIEMHQRTSLMREI